MALVVKDRVRETSTTIGTGTITLNGPVSGFQSFLAIGDGNTTYYTIVDGATGDWEVGIGTYTAAGTTLSRDTVLESSTGGVLVDFVAGTRDVFCTYPAERSVYTDAAGSVITPATASTLPVSSGGTGATTLTGVVKGTGTSALTAGAVNLASEVSGTLPIANGGTGLTSTPTNGQIDIGNGTGFTRTTLTAGSGINISNGAGSISIAATNTGTVTSVGGTGTVNGITLSGTVTSSGNLTLGGTLSGVDLATQVTGTLPVGNGGTGATTFASNNVLLGNGAGSFQVVAPGTSGNVLTSNGTTWTSSAPPAQSYPSAGIAVSTGTAWGTSKTSPTGDIVGTTDTQTLTNKTIDGNLNTITNVTPPEIKTPTNVSPANSATNIGETPTLTGSEYGSLYGITKAAAQWQVSTVSNFATTVISTGDVAGTGVTYNVASGVLSPNTTYYWRVRYKDANGVYSEWSTGTSFTTATEFNNFIPTPAATPAIGASFEGGFYTGLIWNQVTQSATSTSIGTGSKVFTVTDTAPLFYSGQAVEIRSRANPSTNRMIGTVTGSSGTTLTVNVTSVDGSGTYTDWSVMAKYRVIVAPKSSGESSSKQWKNANTAGPSATGTLTEGLKSTLAMAAAGDSTVYPAAHFCNDLVIGGYSDWYLPARDELELIWRNLKPTVDNNYTTANRPTGATIDYKNLGSLGDTANTHGTNNNSSPQGAAYTTTVPGQTSVAAFKTGGAEAMMYGSNYYWSSTEYSTTSAWDQEYDSSFPGYQGANGKVGAYYVRAVRRSII